MNVEQATWRTPRGNAAEMAWRPGTNDWNTLCSCMTEDEYGLAAMSDVGTMVDVGGYLGGVGIGWAIDHPSDRVWIVEPLADNAALIRSNVERNTVGSRVTLVEAAANAPGIPSTRVLWDFGDDESGRHHRYVGNASIATHSERHQSAEVGCVDLAGLVQMAGGHIDFMKIDCEGGEYALFQSPATEVGTIVGEFHKGFSPLQALLEGTHVVTITSGSEQFGGFKAVPK